MNPRFPWLVVVLLSGTLLASISGCTPERPDDKQESSMLECRAFVEKTVRPDHPVEVGQLRCTLKNVSDMVVEIKYFTDPILDHLSGEVRQPDGKIVKCTNREGLTPVFSKPALFTLKPGQIAKVDWGLYPIGGSVPGIYRVQMVFEYEKLKAVSSIVEVDLKAIRKK